MKFSKTTTNLIKYFNDRGYKSWAEIRKGFCISKNDILILAISILIDTEDYEEILDDSASKDLGPSFINDSIIRYIDNSQSIQANIEYYIEDYLNDYEEEYLRELPRSLDPAYV